MEPATATATAPRAGTGEGGNVAWESNPWHKTAAASAPASATPAKPIRQADSDGAPTTRNRIILGLLIIAVALALGLGLGLGLRPSSSTSTSSTPAGPVNHVDFSIRLSRVNASQLQSLPTGLADLRSSIAVSFNVPASSVIIAALTDSSSGGVTSTRVDFSIVTTVAATGSFDTTLAGNVAQVLSSANASATLLATFLTSYSSVLNVTVADIGVSNIVTVAQLSSLPTPSATSSATGSATATSTATGTMTLTSTSTATSTSSSTMTGSSTSTGTSTGTSSMTATGTSTSSLTSTSSGTGTSTSTTSVTGTSSTTGTATSTASLTSTSSTTSTGTSTASVTSTSSTTSTASSTSSQTATGSSTSTSSQTSSATGTGSSTSTSSVTGTSSSTGTSTATSSVTATSTTTASVSPPPPSPVPVGSGLYVSTVYSNAGPPGMTPDGAGNIYFTGSGGIQKLRATAGGVTVTMVAGNTQVSGHTNGVGTAATFTSPTGIVYDSGSGTLFLTESSAIRSMVVSSSVVATVAGGNTDGSWSGFADGVGTAASFNTPWGIALDGRSSPTTIKLYVADYSNHAVRLVTVASGVGTVTTVAGGTGGYADGTGTNAQFNNPMGIAVDTTLGVAYVVEYNGNYLRRVQLPNGATTTLAGTGSRAFTNGIGTNAAFNNPQGVVLDADRKSIFVMDTKNSVIRRYIISSGMVMTLAGSSYANGNTADGSAQSATFKKPISGFVDGSGKLYVGDTDAVNIRLLQTPPP